MTVVFKGIVTEFSEKKDYKPKVAIEYVDDRGRVLSAKEAFRKLSHRFHGKGSGKTKQEKRMKKIQEEETMKHMSSTDTPLNTVAMMKSKLKTESSPYIVLSGAGKNTNERWGLTLKKIMFILGGGLLVGDAPPQRKFATANSFKGCLRDILSCWISMHYFMP